MIEKNSRDFRFRGPSYLLNFTSINALASYREESSYSERCPLGSDRKEQRSNLEIHPECPREAFLFQGKSLPEPYSTWRRALSLPVPPPSSFLSHLKGSKLYYWSNTCKGNKETGPLEKGYLIKTLYSTSFIPHFSSTHRTPGP